MRRRIRETRALTSLPFGVNLNLEFPQEERLAACLDEGVRVVSFFWRDPASLVPRAKAGGARVLHTVGSAAEAKRAADCGVDIVVAQGWEAGGHVRGMVATMPLVPTVVDAIKPTPVVAAGGIADGRGLAAALALGAQALGLALASLRALRRRFTVDTGSFYCGRAKPTRFISITCSMSAGQMRHTARFETERSKPGKARAGPRPAYVLAKGR